MTVLMKMDTTSLKAVMPLMLVLGCQQVGCERESKRVVSTTLPAPVRSAHVDAGVEGF